MFDRSFAREFDDDFEATEEEKEDDEEEDKEWKDGEVDDESAAADSPLPLGRRFSPLHAPPYPPLPPDPPPDPFLGARSRLLRRKWSLKFELSSLLWSIMWSWRSSS